MKKRNALILTLLASLSLILSGCGNAQHNGSAEKDSRKYLPSITGNAGDVLIVINKSYWEGEAGSRLREILASEYPHLPQREPIFILNNIPHNEFSGACLVHRNIVLMNISPDITETGVKITKNAWAKPQLIVTVNAMDGDQAGELVLNHRELIVNSIEQAERDRIITNSKLYEDAQVRNAVTKNIGGSPYFPKGFTMKKNTPDFMWISQETTHVNQGILIFKYPYTDPDQLKPENIRKKLNDLWQANVPGMRENSYMTFNKLAAPSIKNFSYKGQNMIEVRGLWEVENDYMGGPLVCHIFPDLNRKNIIVLNAFVYAPKYDKRKYLRQVESIIYSFEWK